MTKSFLVDGSKTGVPDEHLRFAKYLKQRYLTIDIFDAETQFFFGFCKIPLFEMMRQNNPSGKVLKYKECEIFNPLSGKGEYKGFLIVALLNEGRNLSVSSKDMDHKIYSQTMNASSKRPLQPQ